MNTLSAEAAVLSRIAKGEKVDQSDIVPFLMGSATSDRQAANLRFAEAYAAAGATEAALALVRRAFDLDRFNVEVFNLAYRLMLTLNRLEELVAVVRESIVMAAEARETQIVYELFAAFNNFIGQWPSLPAPKPEPHSDRLIAWAMELTFGADGPPLAADVLGGRKIRVGVMLAGDAAEESALVRAALGFLKHHDTTRFEVYVYSYLSAEAIAASNPQYAKWIADFQSWGCTFRHGMPGTGLPKILATHKSILLDRLDVLVFNLLVGDYHVLALLRPAPVIVGAIHGNPKGYSMRRIDGALATDAHSHMESLAWSAFITPAVDFESLMPPSKDGTVVTRADLAIPANAIVVMTAGRDYKFGGADFWHSVERVLRGNPAAIWVCCGIDANHPGTVGASVSEEVRSRLRFVPWRKDFVWNVLPLADVVVDTFPAGGAFTIFWAMRIGRPCVSFRSNYLKPFHQLDWSPAFRVVGREDLAIAHGDLDGLVDRVSELIRDPAERRALGEACQLSVAVLDDHRRFARDVGDALIAAIKRKQAQRTKSKAPGP